MNKPIVTVGVTTYNSSKYVIETLESIKSQTYPHLILQISDDCSTDNTIELCKKWIEDNKERFIKTKVIVPEHNTGVSGNANRNWDACETEWFKGIAGDDLLLPNCIEDNLKYVKEHPDAVFVFSKPKPFGASEKKCEKIMRKFDFSFFNLTSEQQLNYLMSKNCIPASTTFCNILQIRTIGIRHDERIPYLEDWPKWINVLKKGIKLFYMNKETVLYRIHEKSLSNIDIASMKFYESNRLFYFYYIFDSVYLNNKDVAIQSVLRHEKHQYQLMLNFKKQRDYFYNLTLVRFLRWVKHKIHD